eukprot:gene5429-9242_t
MPIRDFEKFLIERNLIQTDFTSKLKNKKIGIDAFYWLKKVTAQLNEPYLVAIGGISLGFKALIQKELDFFKQLEITPIFVFNGLSTQLKEREPIGILQKDTKKRQGWTQYELGKKEESKTSFLNSKTTTFDQIQILFQILQENKIEFFRAPYLAFAQLNFWLNQSSNSSSDDEEDNDDIEEKKESSFYIDYIYGGHENLLFSKNINLILNLKKERFEMICKKKVLKDMNLNNEQFLDLSLLSGCFFSNTISLMNLDLKNVFSNLLELILYFKSGYNLILVENERINDGTNYLDEFLKSKCLIKNHLVFNSNLEIQILNLKKCPKDLNLILGSKFPNEIYFLLSQGVISPFNFNILLTKNYYETIPLYDSIQLRKNTFQFLFPFIQLSFEILKNLLNDDQSKGSFNEELKLVHWFKFTDRVLIKNEKYLNNITFPIWNLKEDEIKTLLKNNKKSRADFQFISNNFYFKREKKEVTITTKTLKESQCSILLKFLFLIFNKEQEEEIFIKSISISKLNSEESFILLQIARSGILNVDEFESPFSLISKPKNINVLEGTTNLSSNDELTEKQIKLISRVLSLIQMNFKKDNQKEWNNFIDQDLTSFQSIVNQNYKIFRNLIEMIFLDSYLRKRVLVSPQNLFQFSSKLPFFRENSTNNILGLISKQILEIKNEEELKEFLKNLNLNFPFLESPLEDLLQGFEFFNQTVKMFKVLSNLNDDFKKLSDEFNSIELILKKKVKLIKSFNL